MQEMELHELSYRGKDAEGGGTQENRCRNLKHRLKNVHTVALLRRGVDARPVANGCLCLTYSTGSRRRARIKNFSERPQALLFAGGRIFAAVAPSRHWRFRRHAFMKCRKGADTALLFSSRKNAGRASATRTPVFPLPPPNGHAVSASQIQPA